jgi:N-acyl homoserine lactone hydrolase
MIGGVVGPRRLGILDFGTFEVAEDGRRIPILGYVVDAGERVVLVDTGFPPEYALDAAAAGSRDGLDSFGRVVALTAENLPAGQLARAGLRPEDVTDLVVTHGDVDHVGALHAFPWATLVVARAELEAGPPRYHGGRRPVEWPEQRTQPVDGDEELLPGLTLLSTPGHSPGHLSVRVRLPRTGTVILAIDAISRPWELESGVNGGASDQTAARRSAQRLLELAEAERALLIPGHDPRPQPPLRYVPEWYD